MIPLEEETHWACKKVNCDCDEQTQQWLDEENL